MSEITKTESDQKLEESTFQIPISGLYPSFKSFLDIENNNRIFFSGKYGIGKTYFLRNYFEQNNEDYDVYHLFPVNYQIFANEDIFDLIKYDILSELLSKNPKIFKDNNIKDFVDLKNLAYIWGKDNWLEITKTMISNVPKLGKPMKDVIGLTEQLYEFAKEVNNGEKLIIEEYIDSVKSKSFNETDQISGLIKSKVSEQKGRKKSVLILDDLDRVDPEHIFRLLNILTSYSELENDNKFGFDKIILVGHEKNIRSTFHHKYGIETDFDGYFDKFFSLYVYNFNNKEEIISNLKNLLFKLNTSNKEVKDALAHSGYVHYFCLEILTRAISSSQLEKINLRSLFKGVQYKLPALEDYNHKGDHFYRYISGMGMLDTSINVLLQCTGGSKANLLEITKVCRASVERGFIYDRNYFPFNYFSTSMLIKILGKEAVFGGTKEDSKEVVFKKHKITIGNISNNSHEIETENEALLFYDLLENYLSNEHYTEKDYRKHLH